MGSETPIACIVQSVPRLSLAEFSTCNLVHITYFRAQYCIDIYLFCLNLTLKPCPNLGVDGFFILLVSDPVSIGYTIYDSIMIWKQIVANPWVVNSTDNYYCIIDFFIVLEFCDFHGYHGFMKLKSSKKINQSLVQKY